MLFAKISPAASITIQTGPFESTTVYGEWMTAIVRNYVLGGESTIFSVVFGNFKVIDNKETPEKIVSVPNFESMYTTSVTLSSDQLSEWGTNDEVALSVIAQSINATISAFQNVPEIKNV